MEEGDLCKTSEIGCIDFMLNLEFFFFFFVCGSARLALARERRQHRLDCSIHPRNEHLFVC